MRSSAVSTVVMSNNFQANSVCFNPWFNLNPIPYSLDSQCMRTILDEMSLTPLDVGFDLDFNLKDSIDSVNEHLSSVSVSEAVIKIIKEKGSEAAFEASANSIARSLGSKESNAWLDFFQGVGAVIKGIASLLPPSAPGWAKELDYKLIQAKICLDSTSKLATQKDRLAGAEKEERECLMNQGLPAKTADRVIQTTKPSYKNVPQSRMGEVYQAYCHKSSHCFTHFKTRVNATRETRAAKQLQKQLCNFKAKR